MVGGKHDRIQIQKCNRENPRNARYGKHQKSHGMLCKKGDDGKTKRRKEMKRIITTIINALKMPFNMMAILKEESQNIAENGDWGERGGK